MASNKRDLKSYVRYDGNGRIIPGSNVLRRNIPKVGKWKETQAYECCNELPPTQTYNFDITADWSLTIPPVVDESSFRTFLESGEDGNGNVNELTGVVVTDFLLEDGRLRCNLIATGDVLFIVDTEVSVVNGIGNILGIQDIYLQYNQIVTFDPTTALPSSLTTLDLAENQIVIFDPSIALPSLLQNLWLQNNQIVTFDPTLPLPNSLQLLQLESNQIVTFDPSLLLPNSLQLLNLGNNQITTSGYIASESWANAMSVIPGRGDVYFNDNIDSVSGTNLETILIAKGWTVNA
jgi:hypothetical protein